MRNIPKTFGTELMAADQFPDGAADTRIFMARSSSRLAFDRRAQLKQAHVESDQNPFRNPPPGFEAGLQEAAVDDLVNAIANGQHVLVTGPRGSGKYRVSEEFYERCLFAFEERIVTSPESASFAGLRTSSAVEITTVIHLSAINLITFMEMPTERAENAARAIRLMSLDLPRRPQDRSALDDFARSEVFVQTLLGHLSVIADESNRSLALRLRAADRMGKQQYDLLVRALAHADANCPQVRMVVSGLPSATVSMAAALRARRLTTTATEVALQWRLDQRAYDRAAQYIVEMTAQAEIPFSEDAAYRLVNVAQGMKSLINEIGIATWDFARENDLAEVSGATIEMVAPRVIEAMREKYQRALEALQVGHPAAKYVKALYDLTRESGVQLHTDEAVMVRAGLKRHPGLSHEHREQLRAEGYTMRSIDGKVGLADPHLGLVMEMLVPEAAHILS
ncbi:MAG: hypothetical protein ACOYN3_07105 [Acidimicrobiia bacterium]